MSDASTMPPSSFELLLEENTDDEGPGLPDSLRAVYSGDWRLPASEERPYLYVNFCVSRDGRVSFNEPGHVGGGDVSGSDLRDRWLMGLLRARADAVLVGEGTLCAEPEHVWTAEFVCPDDAPAFAGLRRAEGRQASPLQVFLSFEGKIPLEAAALQHPNLEAVVATTEAGVRRLRGEARLELLELGADAVDLERLAGTLAERYGVRTLLCEGGPRVYGSLLRARLPCDEFLTLSPLVLGESDDGPRRPSLVEGAGFPPGGAPASRLLSVRRAGGCLYLRSRYT